MGLKGGMNQNAKPGIFYKANLLRRKLTSQEIILWNELKDRKLEGLKFRKQHPIHFYILDFYCAAKKVSIELDGESHQFSKEYDNERTTYLAELGIKEIRFRNEEIDNELERVLQMILELCR